MGHLGCLCFGLAPLGHRLVFLGLPLVTATAAMGKCHASSGSPVLIALAQPAQGLPRCWRSGEVWERAIGPAPSNLQPVGERTGEYMLQPPLLPEEISSRPFEWCPWGCDGAPVPQLKHPHYICFSFFLSYSLHLASQDHLGNKSTCIQARLALRLWAKMRTLTMMHRVSLNVHPCYRSTYFLRINS